MPNAAVVAAALTDHSARAFALWVGGVDWLKQPGVSGNLYGVPLDSIEVVENGPGGVSSLRFSLEDPLKQVTLPTAGSEVSFYDLTDDHPEFLGYVQRIDPRPHEGQQGKWIDVECIGIECLLDWIIVPSLVLTPLTLSLDAFQSAAASAPLRTAPGLGGTEGNQAGPIAATVTTFLLSTYTITGQTLRESIRQIWNQIDPAFADRIQVTVDFTRGLRIWHDALVGILLPQDYIALTVDDDAFTNTSSDLHYTLTPADVIRNVLVIGNGGTAYGPYSDGSGIIGQGSVINDSTVTTSTVAFRTAQQYLGQFAATVRGSFHLQTFNHGSTNYRAGTYVQLTEFTLGVSHVNFSVNSIRKTYNSNGTEEWDVSFGGLAPSAMNALRRQTRATLS